MPAQIIGQIGIPAAGAIISLASALFASKEAQLVQTGAHGELLKDALRMMRDDKSVADRKRAYWTPKTYRMDENGDEADDDIEGRQRWRVLCVPGTLLTTADLLIRRRTCPGMILRWRCG